MFFLDTSILAAYYMPERKTSAIQKILSKPSPKIISPLVHVELFSVVSRRVRMGDYTGEVAREIATQFRHHISTGCFGHIPVTQNEYSLAADWISQFNTPLRTLDALHLASAHHSGLTLLTADKALATSAKKLGISVKYI